MRRRDQEVRRGEKKGLSEVLLEEVQQRNLIMLSRLWAPDAVSLVGINLEKKQKTTQQTNVDS